MTATYIPPQPTKTSLGLSNVDNTSDVSKPLSTAASAALATTVHLAGEEQISGLKTFQPSLSSTKGLIVKGAVSQTANLQEWQDDTGTAKSYVDDAGNHVVKNSTYFDVLSTTGTVGVRIGMDAGNNMVLRQMNSNGSSYFGNGSTANTTGYVIFQSAGENRIIVGPEGTTTFNPNGSNGVGVKTVVVKASASQTANLQEWQNSSGTVLASIGSGSYTATVSAPGGTPVYLGGSSYGTSNIAGQTSLAFYASVVGGSRLLLTEGSVTLKSTTDGSRTIWGYYEGMGNYHNYIRSEHYANGGNGIQFDLDTDWVDGLSVNYATRASSVSLSTYYTTTKQEGLRIQSASDHARVSVGGAVLSDTNLTVHAQQAADKGIVVRGFASQTASLQEWQDSTGSMLLSVRNDGDRPVLRFGNTASSLGLSIQNGSGTEIIRLQDNEVILASSYGTLGGMNLGNFYVQRGGSNKIDFGEATQPAFRFHGNGTSAAFSDMVNIESNIASTKGLIVKGAVSQTANLQEWQDSSGTVIAQVEPTGIIRASRFQDIDGGYGYIDMGGSSQALVGNSFEWTNNGNFSTTIAGWQTGMGTTFKVAADFAILRQGTGNGAYNALKVVGSTDQTVSVGLFQSLAPGGVGLAVKGAASQTANLFEAQNSDGTALTAIGGDGKINKFAGITPSANADTSGATVADLEVEVNELKSLLRSIGFLAA